MTTERELPRQESPEGRSGRRIVSPGVPAVGMRGRLRRIVKREWFLIGLVFAVGLAWISPSFGARGGVLHPELLTRIGIIVVFFLHGVALPTSALARGTLHWRLHLPIQLTTYLLFPVVGYLLIRTIELGGAIPTDLRIGLLFLSVLPSTVSSSITMTAVAGGNVSGAVFNATLSNLAGVLITPFFMRWFLAGNGNAIAVGKVLMDLFTGLVLPLIAGQLLRPILGRWVSARSHLVHAIDRSIILFLVYTSFCDSMRAGVWSGHGLRSVAITLSISIVLLGASFAAVAWAGRRLSLRRDDKITATFCASQKSLATGIPMARLIFSNAPGLGLIMLPIMIYHPLQLVVGSAFASRWAREGKEKPTQDEVEMPIDIED